MNEPPKQSSDELTEAEIERRRESALKRMLSTPHTPQKPIGKQKASPKRQKRTAGKGSAHPGESEH